MISGGMKRHALTGNQVLSSDFKAYHDEYDAANLHFSLLAFRRRGTLKSHVNINALERKLT